MPTAVRNTTSQYGHTFTFAGTAFTTGTLYNGDTLTSVPLAIPGALGAATVAGSPYTITPSAAVGTGLGDYAITYVDGQLTVNRATLTVTGLTAVPRVYNATTSDTLSTSSARLSGIVYGDILELITSGYAASFNNPNAGNNKPVIVTGMSLSGPAAGNYVLEQFDFSAPGRKENVRRHVQRRPEFHRHHQLSEHGREAGCLARVGPAVGRPLPARPRARPQE